MIKKTVVTLLLLMSILVNFNISFCDDDIEETEEDDIEVSSESCEEKKEIPIINSRIAVVYDRKSGEIIWGKNENQKSAMASTTKIMTAIVVVENANLDDIVTVSTKAATTGGSRLGLKKDDKITVRDLLYGLMLKSGNDAAVALAEYVGGDVNGFADMMNEKASMLKLTDTHFVTPHGLDDPEHYTTASELAKITEYALENKVIYEIVGTKYHTISINGYPKDLSNTNELLGKNLGVYGVKTGFTGNAGRCLVTSVKREDIDVIIVVLQADTKKDRSRDTLKIIDYIYDNYCLVNIKDIVEKEFYNWKNINKKRICINKAKKDGFDINISKLKNDKVLLEKKYVDDINIEVECLYNMESPVQKDTIIGNMKITAGGKCVDSLYLFIDRDVERKRTIDYFFECLKKYKGASLNISQFDIIE